MSLVLQSSGGGQITIQEPATASNFTQTLPAAAGNVVLDSTAGVCRAWVNFNGTGTVAIRASFNVSSITDNGTGNYTVNFTTAMPDVNYSSCISASDQFPTIGMCPAIVSDAGAYVTNRFQFITINQSTTTYFDSAIVSVQVFR